MRGHPRSCADRRRLQCGHVTSSAMTRCSAPICSPALRDAFAFARAGVLDPRPRVASFRVKRRAHAFLSPTLPNDFCNYFFDARAHPTSDRFLTAYEPGANVHRRDPHVALASRAVLFRVRTARAIHPPLGGWRAVSHTTLDEARLLALQARREVEPRRSPLFDSSLAGDESTRLPLAAATG